jgi:hypothetical protein
MRRGVTYENGSANGTRWGEKLFCLQWVLGPAGDCQRTFQQGEARKREENHSGRNKKVKFNAIIWYEDGRAKTVFAGATVDDTGMIVEGTQYSLRHKRPYTVEELQADYPTVEIWLEKRPDADEIYREEMQRALLTGLPAKNYKL